jgi:glycerol kinase
MQAWQNTSVYVSIDIVNIIFFHGISQQKGLCAMNGYVIALDQGTTSSRAIVFDALGNPVTVAQYPFPQIYPHPGWVEHDPMTILHTEIQAAGSAFEKSGLSPTDIAGIGVTNQRETTIVWDKNTGEPVYNAIVWQCRRTAPICDKLLDAGMEMYIKDTTGLLIDAYFSGTKIKWILDNVPGARERAERGELLFGNVDSWLIWNLTGGKAHVSDYSNCSRTMLFNIDKLAWDEDICKELGIPMSMLPQPVPSSMVYGTVAPGVKGLEALAGVPVCGSAGDQAAALLGQGCIEPGQAKNTYGTGCFTLMNTGALSPRSVSGLVTSVAWSIGGKTTYALEGSVFNAGSSIQWLRDEVGSSAPPGSATCWPRACPTTAECTWSPRSRAWARRAGTCTPGAPSWGSPGAAPARISPEPRWRASPIRSRICWTPWSRTPGGRCRCSGWTAAPPSATS